MVFSMPPLSRRGSGTTREQAVPEYEYGSGFGEDAVHEPPPKLALLARLEIADASSVVAVGAGVQARQAQGKPNVVAQFVEQPPAANFAARLVHLCDAAELRGAPATSFPRRSTWPYRARLSY